MIDFICLSCTELKCRNVELCIVTVNLFLAVLIISFSTSQESEQVYIKKVSHYFLYTKINELNIVKISNALSQVRDISSMAN